MKTNWFAAMHVAHILRKYNPSEWGGTETAVKQLLDGLDHHGVSNEVYAPRCETTATHDPFADAGHRVNRYRAVVPVWNISEEQRRRLISIGGNILSFDLFLKLLTAPADIFHTHVLNRIGGIALTAAKLRRKPLVVTIHGGVLDLPKSVQSTLAAPLEGGYEWGKFFGAALRSRRVMELADAIITCNPREAELAQEKYPNQRILVQPHGVPLAKFATDHRQAAYAAYPNLRTRKVLLTVGRLDPVKNQGWLLTQLPEIVRRHPDAQLVLAGAVTDELYGKALRKEVRRLGLEEHVLFTGGLPPNDPALTGLFQLADILVVPSLSETFGLVILEGWAARKPVISSRTSGALSLVQHGTNGLLFDVQHPEQLHEMVEAIIGSAATATRLGEAGHLLAASKYDTVQLAGRIKDLYAELRAQPPKTGSR
jgi:alpha-maltose-1-phosphate synthase